MRNVIKKIIHTIDGDKIIYAKWKIKKHTVEIQHDRYGYHVRMDNNEVNTKFNLLSPQSVIIWIINRLV